MPDQVVPVTQLASTGVILDTPPVALPPNAFTNARNVRFRDGAVRKMEGEVDIFAGMELFFEQDHVQQLQFLAWWPSPNQATNDAGYYIFVVEESVTGQANVHHVYAMLPGAIFEGANPTSLAGNYHRISPDAGFDTEGNWQSTLFNGGFTFILNNGIERPHYVTEEAPDAGTAPEITDLALTDLPGWDSYTVNEQVLNDVFNEDEDSRTFDIGQPVDFTINDIVVLVTNPADNSTSESILIAADSFAGFIDASVDATTGTTVLTFSTVALPNSVNVSVNIRSKNPVSVSAAIVRAFGDFLVAGNLVERDSVISGNPIVRRLTGVVRSSDVAQPGAIPNNWNPFAAGVSTADEFVIADTGTVQDMVALQGNLYLYTNSSISVMRLTGNAQVPLAVQPVTDQYGALTTDSVLEYDGKHFVIGSDDMYLFGGHPGSIQSISDQKVRRAFFNRINPVNDNIRNLFTLRYAARDEIWVCFPTIDSIRGENDEAYIWNYRNGTWTIRELNSVIGGAIAPVPGGGVPSAVITFAGESGTDDLAAIGALEVQTLQIDPSATIGHAQDPTPELQTFQTLASIPNPVAGDPPIPRPAVTADAAELIEVQIGTDFYSGPNPARQTYDIVGLTGFEAGSFASGGARLTLTYTDPADSPAGGTATIHANELGLSDGQVTVTEYVDALVTRINNDLVPAFTDWTASRNGNNLQIVSDTSGARPLGTGQQNSNPVSFTTFTTQAETITNVGPFTDETRVFSDTFGDELFTVIRSGEGPYSYAVTTTRDTGFPASDDITQLAFISDGDTFSAPDPFNAASGTFTFNSASNSYTLRSTPPANFVNLIRQTDNVPNSGEGTFDPAVTEDGVNIERTTTEGGFTQNGMGTQTFENVVVTVADSTIPEMQTNTPGQSVTFGGGTTNRRTGNRDIFPSVPAGTSITISGTTITGPATLTGAQTAALLGDPNTEATSIISVTTNTRGTPRPNVNGTYTVAPTGTFDASFRTDAGLTGWAFGIRFTGNVSASPSFARYSTLAYVGTSTNAFFRRFVGRQGLMSDENGNQFGSGPISWSVGEPIPNVFDFSDISAINVGSVTTRTTVPAIPRRSFQVNNPNPYPIDFVSNSGVTFNNLSGNSATVNGPNGNADEGWSWSSDPISFSGTSIGGSGTTPVASLTDGGRAQTIMHGVTVVSQNTSTVESTTMVSGREPFVLAPASNGNSISNPETFTFNPGAITQVLWSGSSGLSAYRVFTTPLGAAGTRVSGGSSSRFPNNSFGGFDEGALPQTPTLSATNIPNPISLPSGSVVGGVGTGGTELTTYITGIQQSTNTAIRTAIVHGRGRNPAYRGEAARSFSQRLYLLNSGATGVRAIVFGGTTQVPVVTPRVSQETITITNSNPFPVIFTRAGVQTNVPANGSVTLTNVAGEGVAWAISTPTTTQYQFTVTNNNVRPLVSGTLTHGSGNVDLAGLAPGAEAVTGFSTDANAGVTFVREIPQQTGGSTNPTTLYQLDVSGIGAYEGIEVPVRYNFTVNFTDSTPNIDIDYVTPENRVPGAPDNLTNLGAEVGFLDTLRADAAFNTYFTAIDGNDDPGVPAGAFRIEARAIPGEEVSPGVFMPPHDALIVAAEVDQQFGGDADLTVRSIRRGTANADEPITVMLSTGTRVPQANGTLSDVRMSTHGITLQGIFPDDADGIGLINEQFRQVFRNDPDYRTLWNIRSGDSLNPATIGLSSQNNGPHFNRVTEVTPAESGITPEFFRFTTDETGRIAAMDPTYPTITLTPPIGTALPVQTIELVNNMDMGRPLVNTNIAEIIRTQFSAEGWSVQTPTSTPNLAGTGVGGNMIKIVNGTQESVIGDWAVTSIDYGNTGTTLADNTGEPGLAQFNLADITRNTSSTNLDFRGEFATFNQPTRVMVQVSNPDFPENSEGERIQYIPFVFGEGSTYDPLTQMGDKATRIGATDMVSLIDSGVSNVNRRVNITRQGNRLTILPTQFSELANFVLDVFVNDSVDNVNRWNAIVNDPINMLDSNLLIVTNDPPSMGETGIQSYFGPDFVPDNTDSQANPSTTLVPGRTPVFTTAGVVTTTPLINRIFDPLRPWPTSQVNLNREFPIFATAVLDTDTGDLTQNFRGADLGFLFITDPYESFVERIELAITPEFDTEQLTALALWADGGTARTFGGNIEQATLQVNMYGTDSPGSTQGTFTMPMNSGIMNPFVIGQDYKVDMRIHGRFINLRITDAIIDLTDPTPVVSWSISGMQADVMKGGTR